MITLQAQLHKHTTNSPSSSPKSDNTHAALFLFTRPGRPPPKGDVRAKSMCFWLSTRTMKLGMLTTCLPTLQVQQQNTSQKQTHSNNQLRSCIFPYSLPASYPLPLSPCILRLPPSQRGIYNASSLDAPQLCRHPHKPCPAVQKAPQQNPRPHPRPPLKPAPITAAATCSP